MKYLPLLIVLAHLSCQSLAPSNYELNRRSGLRVSIDNKDERGSEKFELRNITAVKAYEKNAAMPARAAPVIEKIWMFDQIVNEGEWMQGTWIFIEVEKAKWLPELDSGSNSFIDTGKVGLNRKKGNS